MAALIGDNEDYILNYDKLLEINEALVKQYLDIIYMYMLCFNMDRHTYNYGLMRDKKTGEIISMAPNFDNNIALISRGYTAQAKNSANLLIELFGELLKEKNIRYDLHAVSRDEVIKIAESSLPDEKIDRNYVADFVMDRYERIEQHSNLFQNMRYRFECKQYSQSYSMPIQFFIGWENHSMSLRIKLSVLSHTLQLM